MTRDMISETFARLFTVLVICLMIGSGMVAITFPFGAGAAPEGGFELNENVTANLTTIAPAVVNEGDTFIGMINISFRNTGGINDTLEWINVQVKNYTNVVTVSIWNETNDDSTFSTLSDTLMGVVAPSPLAGDIGYANFTGLNMGIMNNTNMSVYVAFNISSTATHADQINASVMMNNVFMTFAGQGGNRSLYPSYDTRIDNINVTASLTTVAPGVVNAGDNNVGMINITIFNNGGADDTLDWLNTTILNYVDVDSVALWIESNGDGSFSTLSDTFLVNSGIIPLTGNLGYANFTGLDISVLRYTDVSLYVVFNISSTAAHGDLINATIAANNINFSVAGRMNNAPMYPSFDTSIYNINLTVTVTTIAPLLSKAGAKNVAMLNVTLTNMGGIKDILIWINVSIQNYADVDSVSIWNETNFDGVFNSADDTHMAAQPSNFLSGNTGFANLTGLNMGIERYTSMTVYITFNISASAVHGHLVNSSLLPYQISFFTVGQREMTAFYPEYETEIDAVRPTIVSVTTTDPDNDGKVENATIKFSEPILDSTIDVTRFAIGGMAAISFSTLALANDEYIEISIAGVDGTDAKDVTYTYLVDKTTDTAGNELNTVNSNDVVEMDGAPPVIISAVTDDKNSNGKIDRYVLGLSENSTVYSGFFDTIVIAGYTVDKPNSLQSAPDEITVALFEGPDFDTGAIPDITYSGIKGIVVDNVPPVPIDIASGDLNNDSIPDIVLLNAGTGTITVYINDGTGDIASSNSYPAGIKVGNITVGDASNDGLNDVVASDYDTGEIKVFVQNMTNNMLKPYVKYTSGAGPLGLAIGDVTEDELNDVVVANFNDDQIAVFKGNSGGTLDSPTKYNSGDGPTAVVIADIAGTENIGYALNDVVAVNLLDDTITPFRQTTSATLSIQTSISTPSAPTGIAAGDIDGDGWTDIVITSRGDNKVSIFKQRVSIWTNTYIESTSTDYDVDLRPESIAVIDADSDRDADIIFTTEGNNSVTFLLQESGSFSQGWTKSLANEPIGLSVDDLTVDGAFDAVTTQPDGNSFSIIAQKIDGFDYMPLDFTHIGSTGRNTNPRGVDIGDVNNDGLNDIVVADYNRVRISVYYGNPAGGYKDRVDYEVYKSSWWYPEDVKIGDLNDDGLNDVAFTIANTNRMGIMYQGQNGILKDTTWHVTYTSSRRLDIGDINNDTLNDIVVTTNDWQGRISVFTQNPSTNLMNSKSDYVTNIRYPYGVAIGEVSGDHLPDVVITGNDYSNNLYHMARLKQNSGGTLDAAERFQWENDYYKNIYDVGIGDFNNDGRNDIVASRQDSAQYVFGVWYQSASNSFSFATTYSTFNQYDSRDLAVADFNGDGKDDVAISFYSYEHVMVYVQGTTGLNLWGTYAVGRDPWGIAAGDLNHDGLVDIVTANYYGSSNTGNSISILIRDNDKFTFNGHVMDFAGDSPYQIAQGDLNDDGNIDIAVASQGSPYYMYVFYGSSSGRYSSVKSYALPGYPYSIEIGDLNDDDRDDVVVGDSNGRFIVFNQKSDGTLSSYSTYTTYNIPFDIAIGDINSDGRNDIVGVVYDRMVRHYQSTSGTFSSYSTYYTNGDTQYGIEIGDINNDSRNDVVISSYSKDTLYYWTQSTSGSLTGYYALSVGDSPRSVRIADINNDGLNDIININYGSSDGITVTTQKSSGGFNTGTHHVQNTAPWDVEIADMDGDGLNDAILTDYGTSTLSLYTQNQNGGLESRRIYNTFYDPRYIELVDLNDDGILEIITTHSGYDFISTSYQIDIGTDSDLLSFKMGTNSLKQITSGDIIEQDGADPIFGSAITGNYTTGQSSAYTTLLVRFSEDINESTLNGDGSDFTVGGHTVTSASEVRPGDVELTVSTLTSYEMPMVTLTGTVIDAVGVTVSTIARIPADGLRPRVTTAETRDSDLDGLIDQYVITFDEDIFGTFDGTGYSVVGYSIDADNSSKSASNVFTLALYEKVTYDTGLTPNIVYVPGDMQDSSGNYLKDMATTVESDGAPPAVSFAYVNHIRENHPNLHAPDETTLYYNNTPAGLSAPFTIQVEATDNGNLDYSSGEDAFGNTSVQDTTENTGGTVWEYELTYEINQGETKNPSILVWVYDLDSNNATDSISVVLDNSPPTTNIVTPLGTDYVPPFQPVSLVASDMAGIYLTKYRIDSGPWQNYTGPFYLGSYGFGYHSISYYSIDNVNNTETVHAGDVYVTRDWTDGGPGSGTYSNTVILGCNLTIDGTMIFENVTLLMNNTAYDNQWINVTGSGKLVVRNSTIIAVDTDYHHRFLVSGELDLFQTNVGDLWADPSTNYGGIEIYSDSAKIEKGNFYDATGMAITVFSSSPAIRNSTFRDSYGGIGADGGAPIIFQNDIANVTVGIGIMNNTGQMIISGNDIDNAFYGIYGQNLLKTDNNFRITDNDFTNINGHGVYIKGTNSATQQLLIDYNRFENVNGGIHVENVNTPDFWIVDNTITNLTGNGKGISTYGSENVNIRRNNFINSYGDSIEVRKNTGITKIDNNTIDGGTGIQYTHNAIEAYQNEGKIYILNNIIKNTDQIDAIGVWENENNTMIYVNDNQLTDNNYGGIWFWEYADLVSVNNNDIEDNSYGIWAEHIEQDINDTLYIKNNQIKNGTKFGGWSAGISIDNINNLVIEDNYLFNIEDVGIEIYDVVWGDLLVEGNTMKDNGEEGLYLWDPTIDLGNSIKNNTYINNDNGNYAIYVDFNPGTWDVYDRSEFVNNYPYFGGNTPDMVFHDGSNWSFASTRLDWFGDIEVQKGGVIYAYDTVFSGPTYYDFDVFGSIYLKSCTVENAEELYIEDPDSIYLGATTIQWGNSNGIHLKNANITLANVYFFNNNGNGLFIEDSNPIVQLCEFRSNGDHGIYADNFDGMINQCEFLWNGEDNINMVDSSGTIYYNFIYSAGDNNIHLKNSDSTIQRNAMWYSGDHSIYLDNSDAHILENDPTYMYNVRYSNWGGWSVYIRESDADGIYSYYSNPHIENNTIWGHDKNGVSMIYSGGHVEYNEIAWNTGSGIGTFNEQSPSIHDNYLHDNGDSPPNRPPSATGGTIAPSNPIYTSTLSITPVGWYDPDGDPANFIYQWQQNLSGTWTNIAGATGSTLSCLAFGIGGGDEIRARLTPWDGKTTGPTVNSSSIIIGNSAPSITSVGISPTPAYDNSALTAVPTGFSDPDGDTTQVYYYQWYNTSGIISGATSSTLPPSKFKANDTVYCIVIPSDGQANGSSVQSSSVFVVHYVDPGQGVEDYDGDGVPDAQDAFPYDINEWKDTDGDGKGDNSDPDIDGDGYNNTVDAFDFDKNEWKDTDSDGVGDNTDQDDDNDGYLDTRDDFPFNATEWRDTDDDGIGDNTDDDIDGDGVNNTVDAFDYDKSETKDSDNDGVGDNSDQDDDDDGYYDIIDAFPLDPTEHRDTDLDGTGDNADTDDDDDGYLDTWEKNLGTNSKDANSKPLDTDNDGKPDGNNTNSESWMDVDDDNDGYNDSVEIAGGYDPKDPEDYPGRPNRAPSITKVSLTPSPAYDNSVLSAIPEGFSDPDDDTTQIYYYQWYNGSGAIPGATLSYLSPSYFGVNDTIYCIVIPSDGEDNGTGIKSNVVLILKYTTDDTPKDYDGDGYIDSQDAFPYDKNEWRDTDDDGIGDNSDTDIDGDGFTNPNDAFDFDKSEWNDTDSDGIGDNTDPDIDGDDVLNSQDDFPFDKTEWKDTDDDGIGDNTDPDIDGDSVANAQDAFPKDKTESKDSDSDGIGDNIDQDDDNDGYYDVTDAFPQDASEHADNDKDGIGDNADDDDDNDGFKDSWEAYLGTDNKTHSSQPLDTDDDGKPDGDATNSQSWMDTDDDGDGATDAVEKAAGTDPLDPNDYPGAPNRPPSITKVSLSPSPAYDNSIITAVPEGYSDPDGDTTQVYYYQWYVNGVKVPGQTQSFLSPTHFSANDTVYCIVTPSDGVDNGTTVKSVIALIIHYTEPGTEPKDFDGDGYPDDQDAFPYDKNEWHDTDGDGIGDNSDPDIDGDGYSNDVEEDAGSNPSNDNSIPGDIDGDGILDKDDLDIDGDNVNNTEDAFPTDRTETKDSDKDGIGDNADQDDDNDGVLDAQDDFPFDPDEWKDSDGDGVGDNTDTDIDGDGVNNIDDAFPNDKSESKDTDDDGVGDNVDRDRDGDGIENDKDDFPTDPNEWRDTDGDGTGDNADTDRDGDGIENDKDEFPDSKDDWEDSDDDGLGDASDPDDDNDGYPDVQDDFPNDPDEWKDSDDDGKGDNSDNDRDGDGKPNANDTFPDDEFEWEDKDGDGLGDNRDPDDDNDGFFDIVDSFPFDPTQWKDSDNDGLGDNPSGSNPDPDTDGDGVSNDADAFPNNPNEYEDTDGDGIGNNMDSDDDGDDVPDIVDDFPLDPEKSEKTAPTEKETGEAGTDMGSIALIIVMIVVLLVFLLIYMQMKKGLGADIMPPETSQDRPGRTPPGRQAREPRSPQRRRAAETGNSKGAPPKKPMKKVRRQE